MPGYRSEDDGSVFAATGNGTEALPIVPSVGGVGAVLSLSPVPGGGYSEAGAALLNSTLELENAFRTKGGTAYLQSVSVVDLAGESVPIDILFLDTNTSLGASGDTPSIHASDDAPYIVGHVRVAASDFVDVGSSSVATVRGAGLMLKAAAGSTSLYVVFVISEAADYAVNGLKFKFGFMWD